MTITIAEKFDSREATQSDSPGTELLYAVKGTDDDAVVKSLVAATSPAVYAGLIRDSYTIKPQGGGVWECSVQYVEVESDSQFTFDTGGGTQHEDLICDYENLVYACNRCNTAKGTQQLLDPTESSLGEHLQMLPTGAIAALTNSGQELILILGLDSPVATNNRKKYIAIARYFSIYPNHEEVRELYFSAFGFPEDLPDLERLRPKGNSRPEGLSKCYFTQRANKELTEVCLP